MRHVDELLRCAARLMAEWLSVAMRECSLRVELAEECELRKGLQEHIKQLQGSAGKSVDSYLHVYLWLRAYCDYL